MSILSDYFKECHHCKPPRRYPGCQDHCPYYKEGKAKLEADREADAKKRKVHNSIYYQTCRRIDAANRKKGSKP